MNNFERIHQELARQVTELAPEVNMSPERLLEIVMELVDAEDQHRISKTNINQQVGHIVLNAALQTDSAEDR